MGVNDHFEPFSNAERRRPSVFQQTASGVAVSTDLSANRPDLAGTICPAREC
jgi:hypothetical protein